jgi:hypothetical protein
MQEQHSSGGVVMQKNAETAFFRESVGIQKNAREAFLNDLIRRVLFWIP